MTHRALGTAVTLFLLTVPASAADWPMWRHDAQRSACSPQELPMPLRLHWVRDLPPEMPAWPEQDKMPFDSCYEPIVIGNTLYVNSSRHDCVRALDVATGEMKWVFFTDGPVRFAPLHWKGKLYFTSDDGYLYCVAADSGSLQWKLRGGPGDRKILGNERLISTWPARGAPVIHDGTLYFAASIWPFMGIFIHAVDPNTGQIVWTNDGEGSLYMKQPHMADAFASIAPQGPLAATDDLLLIPGGRSVPATFDRKTGKLLRYPLAENGKRGGGFDVSTMGNYFFNGGAAFELSSGKFQGDFGKLVALTPDTAFTFFKGSVRVFDLKSAVPAGRSKSDSKQAKSEKSAESKSGDVKSVDAAAKDAEGAKDKSKSTKSAGSSRWLIDEIAELKTPPLERLIKAGSRLYGGGDGFILAIDVDPASKKLKLAWKEEVPGKVTRLVVGADRLFAATSDGPIYCFGQGEKNLVEYPARVAPTVVEGAWVGKAHDVLQAAGGTRGYALAWGLGSGGLVNELIRQSQFEFVVLERNPRRVRMAREEWMTHDLYGTRAAVLPGEPTQHQLPLYFCTLMVCENARQSGIVVNEAFLQRAYASLRPYGGKMIFAASDVPAAAELDAIVAKLPKAHVRRTENLVIISREGALPGSADWTHEHADAANTRVGKDTLVKAPLGLLWFGGPSHDGILPRHGHGPQPQVIEGRLIIEGVNVMRALDIYTGQLLWETSLPGVGDFFNNLSHQPGANASGSNFVSTKDGIYVVWNFNCVKLDPATGKVVKTFTLPPVPHVKGTPRWGYLNVEGDYLIGGADPLLDPKLLPPPPSAQGTGNDDEPGIVKSINKVVSAFKAFSDNLSASRHLVAMNRHTGEVIWRISANHSFRHNGTCIGGGRLYSIDRMSGDQIARAKIKLEDIKPGFRVAAFDLATGKQLWEEDDDVFGTWLSYSAKHDVLIEAGRVTRDTLRDELNGMRALNAKNGAPMWFDKNYVGPAMLHGDTILQGNGGCDLVTGGLKLRDDPVTGQPVPWKWTRSYGCNTPAASEHLLTFRSGAAGFFDLRNDGGTGNFGGFRSSCTNNLVVAGGVITAPEYTRTCTCSYQNQSSVGLVHMPEAEMWTYFGTKEIRGVVKRLGINFAAVGDRRAEDGVLWMEYPSIAGASPLISVSMKPSTPTTYRRHSSLFQGPLNWVASSGVSDIQEVTIPVGKTTVPRAFTVRLIFAEPDDLREGMRRFHVDLQGQRKLTDLDLVKEAGGPRRTVIKEFQGVLVPENLVVRFSAVEGSRPPVLAGLELVAEDEAVPVAP